MGLILIFTILLSLMGTYFLSSSASFLRIMDHPNERSLHNFPVVRTGGIAIVFSVLISIFFLMSIFTLDGSLIWIGIGTLLVGTISIIDDILTVSIISRIVIHFIAACLIVAGGYSLDILYFPGVVLALPLAIVLTITIIYVVWMINLYNFMDGMDGLAAGMAVFGFGTFALIGWIENENAFFLLNLIVCLSSLGFLVFNFPPARIFMGDFGSSTLGFLAASSSLWAEKEGIIPLWISILLFSPFIVDSTVTLLSRVLRRQQFWEAHKTHYYQRLVQHGWGHKKVVLCEYAVMLLCCVTAIFIDKFEAGLQWSILILWCCFYIYVMSLIERKV